MNSERGAGLRRLDLVCRIGAVMAAVTLLTVVLGRWPQIGSVGDMVLSAAALAGVVLGVFQLSRSGLIIGILSASCLVARGVEGHSWAAEQDLIYAVVIYVGALLPRLLTRHRDAGVP